MTLLLRGLGLRFASASRRLRLVAGASLGACNHDWSVES
jgi:hypothetical protein